MCYCYEVASMLCVVCGVYLILYLNINVVAAVVVAFCVSVNKARAKYYILLWGQT